MDRTAFVRPGLRWPIAWAAPSGTAAPFAAALQLGVVLGLLELDLWCMRAMPHAAWRAAIYGAIAFVVWRSRDPGRSLLDRQKRIAGAVARDCPPAAPSARDCHGSVRRAAGEVLAATVLLALLLLGVAGLAWRGWPRLDFHAYTESPRAGIESATSKLLVVIAQQFALQRFLWPVWCRLMSSRGQAGLLAAVIFGLLHVPNWALVGLSGMGGGVWVWLYARHGRIVPLVVSHFLLALLAHSALPEDVIEDMRVGIRLQEERARRALGDDPAVQRTFDEIRSPEYYARQGGTAQGFVWALYRDVLHRSPSAVEADYWVGKLRHHASANVAREFLCAAEFQRRATPTQRR